MNTSKARYIAPHTQSIATAVELFINTSRYSNTGSTDSPNTTQPNYGGPTGGISTDDGTDPTNDWGSL